VTARKSITVRLTLLFATASTAVLIALGWWIGIAVERHFVDLDRDELDAKMEAVARLLQQAQSGADVAALPRRIDEALVGHHGLSVAIARPDGSLLYESAHAAFPASVLQRPPAPPAGPTPVVSWERGDHAYRGAVATVASGAADLPQAVVAIGVDIGHHREFMDSFLRTLWAAIAAGIVLTGLLGWIAARRGLAPVRDMARVSHGISATRLSNRLSLEVLPTELVELGTAFNEMLARLEDSFRRLSDFSSDMAHELRTPITNLMTQTQVALSRSRTADEYREVLYSNLEEFDRLARTITDMLFLAKADNGLLVPHREPVDLAAEVRELFDFYEALVEERGIRLELTGGGRVNGDRLMIRRAISNLLSNAIRHTARGEAVRVRIDGAGAEGVRLAVENPGIGIDPEHLPRIFERFYRVDPARQRSTEGAGLGLAITNSIVAAHQGTLRAFSASGVTRFEMSLPAGAGG
jgi:two-component system, OmpR family, heavy metal sensor histidine kinase CusS